MATVNMTPEQYAAYLRVMQEYYMSASGGGAAAAAPTPGGNVGSNIGTLLAGTAARAGTKAAVNGLLGGGGAAAAGSGASGLASTAAANAAWNAGATAAGGGTAAAGGGATLAGLPAAPLAAGVIGAGLIGKGAYDLLKGKKAKGTAGNLGRLSVGIATGGISEIARALMGGKNETQQARDGVRKNLRASGLVDDTWSIGLANGQKFDIGKDGGARLGDGRRYFEADHKNPLTHEAIGFANPLAAIATGGDDDLKTNFGGYFTNAAMTGAGDKDAIRRNARGMYEKAGFKSKDDAYAAINALAEAGKISREDQLAYHNGVNEVFLDVARKVTPSRNRR